MRIIAGEFRGFPLRAPKGEGTRPTIDRVRESMMSSVNSTLGGFEGEVVLDAFAGSGALGLEAVSRGAQTAYFYDNSLEAVRVVTANAEKLGLDARRVRIVRGDVMKNPPKYAHPPFSLILLDPPYVFEPREVLQMVSGLRERGVATAGALVVYEHAAASAAAVDEALAVLGMQRAQRKKYGATMVDMIRFDGETQE
ncbi:RsmD family RNA methyltransferase [Adlercreutzia sp. ZJ138]|uniref:RsmD family RNA methyltransferase n=1 Tax=Adlercreutzia sp. ZJ138 TaxID=2709405 RepID=UPI0013EAA032|nr:RsmD family RNA methyltransferase [Adlercreutzia sp. ZJ138]